MFVYLIEKCHFLCALNLLVFQLRSLPSHFSTVKKSFLSICVHIFTHYLLLLHLLYFEVT